MNLAQFKKGPVRTQGNWNVIFVLGHDSIQWRACENFVMASAVVNRGGCRIMKSVSAVLGTRFYAKVATGTDIVSAAPNVSLQKARTWDEGLASKFSTTPLKDIFKVPLFLFFFLMPFHFFKPPLFFTILLMSFLIPFDVQDKKVIIFGLPVS